MSVNKLLRLLGKEHKPDIEGLSAHLDGRLDGVRAGELAAHAATCAICGAALQEMRELRAMLQAMPVVEVPRSFRLRQADVEAAATVRQPASGGPTAMRWAPALGGMAAALFVVVLGADLLTRGGGGDAQLTASREDTAATGALAADDGDGFEYSSSKTQGDVASAPVPGETIFAGAPLDAETPDECPNCAFAPGLETPSPNASGAADSSAGALPDGDAAPTGAPPDGDAAVAPPETAPMPTGPVAGNEGGTADGPPDAGTDATAAANTARVEVQPRPSPVGELAATATDAVEDDEGNRSGYLIVEIAAAAVAVGAGAALVFWRIRRRGTA